MAPHHVYAERYAKMSEIGGGAAGRVWTARDTATGETVAVKEIQLEDGDGADVEAVRREVSVLAQCDAPSIVRYRGSVLRGSALWIVMEHCAAGSVRQLLDRVGALSEAAALYVVGETLFALAYLHGQGIAHRDIKAANILITAEGRVRVADFGVAAAAGASSAAAGSPYWMAPEAVRALIAPPGEAASYDAFAADVWSVGALLLEALTGAPPHASAGAPRALSLVLRCAPPRLDPARFGADVCALAAACLHDDPARRPSASALLRLRPLRERQAGALSVYLNRVDSGNSYANSSSGHNTDTRMRTLGAAPDLETAHADIVFAAESPGTVAPASAQPVVEALSVLVPADAPCLIPVLRRHRKKHAARLTHLGLAPDGGSGSDPDANDAAMVRVRQWTDGAVAPPRTLGVHPECEGDAQARGRVRAFLRTAASSMHD